MAKPGDPSNADDHDDDLIGFASPASLQGRAREPLEPAAPDAAANQGSQPEDEADLFTPRAAADPGIIAAGPDPVPYAPRPEPTPRPVEASSVFEETPAAPVRRRRRDPYAELPNRGTGLFAVYALILFAVPTLGVSALIALLAVAGRSGPEDALPRSHFIYQKKTLFAGGVAAVVGVILLAAPFALGVPILFLLALWLVLRGATGVWTLKAGRPIADPSGWWI